jgi:hypothetical protein
LNVAVDHLLLGGALAAGLVHDDEPVLIVAAGEERGHLGGGPIAEVGPRVEGRVGGAAGPVHAAPDRGEPGRGRETSYGGECSARLEEESGDGRLAGDGGEEALGERRWASESGDGEGSA